MRNENDNMIRIVSTAFYGNKTQTEIKKKDIDRFILGYQSDKIPVIHPIDRTIINVPNADNVVFVYNKYSEETMKNRMKERNHKLKPLAFIPEEDIEIYSRCIVCRMNEEGEFDSLKNDDFNKFLKYLAD